MQIAVIGLGKLGLPTAACFAAAGVKILGYDKDATLRERIRAGECPYPEPGLKEKLAAAGENLLIVDNLTTAACRADVVLIIVPTPSRMDGRFNNKHVMEVLEELAPTIAARAVEERLSDEGDPTPPRQRLVIDVVSTVMPGSCDGEFKTYLEGKTGQKCGAAWGLVYNPEFIALGSVVRDFMNPDLVLCGASDVESAKIMQRLYGRLLEARFRDAVGNSLRMSGRCFKIVSLYEAEMAKLLLNYYLTLKVSFANSIGILCSGLPGVNVDRILDVIGEDSRIGQKYLTAGLGFGGPCFPRDVQAFEAFTRKTSWHADVNRDVRDWIHNQLGQCCTRYQSKVAVLGLTYKTGTPVIEDSQSIALIRDLTRIGSPFTPIWYDSHVLDRDLPDWLKSFRAPSLEQAIAGSDAAILCTLDAEWVRAPWWELLKISPRLTVIDMWRQLCDGLPRLISFGDTSQKKETSNA